MKLVVLGLSASSAWGNGDATLWRGILCALARSGHDVVFFERDAAHDAARAIEAVLAAPGARVVYDLNDFETPVTRAALERGERGAYLPADAAAGLRDDDLVLSYTGGEALRPLRERLGARRVAPLYACVDVEAHRPAAPRDVYACDLSHLGTCAADRQADVERLCPDVAGTLQNARFVLGGAVDRESMRRPPNVAREPRAVGAQIASRARARELVATIRALPARTASSSSLEEVGPS